MPIIINAQDTQVTRQGPGWTETNLADGEIIGMPAMNARRLIFEPNAHGPESTRGDSDQLLFVIRGSGRAAVNGEELPLDEESVLWLEPGERYQLVAGENGLEILQGYAPGD